MVRGKKQFFKVREKSGNFILSQGKLKFCKKNQGELNNKFIISARLI